MIRPRSHTASQCFIGTVITLSPNIRLNHLKSRLVSFLTYKNSTFIYCLPTA